MLLDISNEEYHAHPAISRSNMMDFRLSPRHYWHSKFDPNFIKKEPSREMVFGNLMHSLLLEPDKYESTYIVPPKFDMRKSDDKIAHTNFIKEHANKTFITNEDFQIAQKMKDAFHKDKDAFDLISDAQYEKTIFWSDSQTGLQCKSRPDVMHNHFIVDYKTISDANERSIRYAFTDYGYDVQAAMIHLALKEDCNLDMREFVYIFQEKKYPYLTRICPLSQEKLAEGIQKVKQYLSEIKICTEKNEWPSYPIITI